MRAPGLHRTGRMPDVARYERVLELHDNGMSRREIMAALSTRDHALLGRALAWRERKALRLARSEPDPVAARVADLELTIARLCGLLQQIMEQPAESGDGQGPDLRSIEQRLDEIAERLDGRGAEVIALPRAQPKKGNERDVPMEMLRVQLGVVVRELGRHKVAELIEGFATGGLERFEKSGALPQIGSEALSDLDRLYVVVRAAQLDLEPDDEDVLAVRRAIRDRQRSEAGRRAWEEAS